MRNRTINDGLRVDENALQVLGPGKTLAVYLVNVFGARGSCREPAALRDDLDAADWRAVARRGAQDTLDLFAREFARLDALRCQRGKQLPLLRGGCGLNPLRYRITELARDLCVERTRITTAACADLCGQQRRCDAIFVGSPDGAVATQEGCPRAFFARETQ